MTDVAAEVLEESVDPALPAVEVASPASEEVQRAAAGWFSEEDVLRIEEYARAMQTSEIPEARAEAFTKLYHATKDNLFATAMGVTENREIAELALADAYTRVWRFMDNFEAQALVTTWLYRILRNCCVNQLETANRERKRVSPNPVDSISLPDGSLRAGELMFVGGENYGEFDSGPEITAQRRYRQQKVAEVVGRSLSMLPQKILEVVSLHYIAGLPVKEVARRLNIKEATVKVRAHRGRNRLREELGGFAEEWRDLHD